MLPPSVASSWLILRGKYQRLTGCLWCSRAENWSFLSCNCGLGSNNRAKTGSQMPWCAGPAVANSEPCSCHCGGDSISLIFQCHWRIKAKESHYLTCLFQNPWFHLLPSTVSCCGCCYSQVSPAMGFHNWMLHDQDAGMVIAMFPIASLEGTSVSTSGGAGR